MGLHILGETRAKIGAVVISEEFLRPESCCALVQSPHLRAVLMVEDTHEDQNQRMEVGKADVLVQQASTGRGSGGKGFADAALLYSYLPPWQQAQC